MLANREHTNTLPTTRQSAPVAQPMLPNSLTKPLAGKRVKCEYVQGRITGMERHTQTHIHSQINYCASSNSHFTTLSSSTSTRTEFHVQRPDGTEEPYWYYWENIPLRNGQSATNVHLHLGKKRVWTMLVNHSNRQSHYVRTGVQVMYDLGAIRQVRWWWMAFLFLPFLLVGLGIGSDAGSGIIGLGLVASLAFFLVGKIVQFVRAFLLWRTVKPELDTLADTLLGKTSRGRS